MPYTPDTPQSKRNAGGYSRAQRTAHREFARRIAELTNDGDDIADALLEIAGVGPYASNPRSNTPAEKRVRLDAIAMLTERYLGKVPQDLNLLVGVPQVQAEFAPLSEDALLELAGCKLLERGDPHDVEVEDAELVDLDEDQGAEPVEER